MNTSFARTRTSPAAPAPNVLAEMRPPVRIVRLPARIITSPPFPPRPVDWLSVPTTLGNFPPMMDNSPAEMETLPPRPAPAVNEEIWPPSVTRTRSASMRALPPVPDVASAVSAAIPVSSGEPLRAMKISPAFTVTSPAIPGPVSRVVMRLPSRIDSVPAWI